MGHYFLITLYLKFIFLQFLFCPCRQPIKFFSSVKLPYNFVVNTRKSGVSERYTVKDHGCMLFLIKKSEEKKESTCVLIFSKKHSYKVKSKF